MAMTSSKMRTSLILAAAFSVVSTGVFAQTAGTPAAGAGKVDAVPVFAKLPDVVMAQFKANPQALLTTYASAGLPLSTEVRSLLLTDPGLIDTLIAVAQNGNDAQKAAIGSGLAQASRLLARGNPQIAATIQQKVAQSGLPQLITAYIAGSNGIETAAVGGGGGGGGGFGGGTGGSTGGLGTSGGSNSGSNPGGNSFGTINGFTGNSSFGTFTGGASASTSGSVSPT